MKHYNDPGGDDGATFSYNLEDKKFTRDMQKAMKDAEQIMQIREAALALHADAIVDCKSQSFNDKVNDDLQALDKCRQYRKVIDMFKCMFPLDEPIDDLAGFAMTHRNVFMPMLEAVTKGGNNQ